MTVRWLGIRPACPRCHLRFDRGEPDYFLGAIVFNMAFAESVFALGLTLFLIWTWPHPPWDTLYYVGIPGMIVAPIFFYPLSKLCWLAFDLAFRPLRPEDLEPPGEAPIDSARG
ncbi:MAG TPA: DUF983 domain-containing protein [Methylomirabilota bacterium]